MDNELGILDKVVASIELAALPSQDERPAKQRARRALAVAMGIRRLSTSGPTKNGLSVKEIAERVRTETKISKWARRVGAVAAATSVVIVCWSPFAKMMVNEHRTPPGLQTPFPTPAPAPMPTPEQQVGTAPMPSASEQ